MTLKVLNAPFKGAPITIQNLCKRSPSWRPFLVSDTPLKALPGFDTCAVPGSPLELSHLTGLDTQNGIWAAFPLHALSWYQLAEEHLARHALSRFCAKQRVWRLPQQTLDLAQPAIMAIWNVTPDSFSTQSLADATNAYAQELIASGADILDIGAESTRPGAQPLTPDEEIERLRSPLAFATHFHTPISLDTRHPQTLAWAADKIDILNDIGEGFEQPGRDEAMFEYVRKHQLGCVIMAFHPHDHAFASFEDCIRGILTQLDQRLSVAFNCGVHLDQIVLDPGIGFGKGLDNDLLLIAHAAKALNTLGRPSLIAHSRKRCIGAATGRSVHERDTATAIASAIAFQNGASLVRVHDPKGSVDARALTRLI